MIGGAGVIGCGGAKKPAKKPAKDKPFKPQTIKSGKSWAIVNDTKGDRLWKVFWNSALVTVADNATGFTAMGDMQVVSGLIYKDAKTACRFSAEQGSVDKVKQLLVLKGNVKMVATNPDAILYCDRMEYSGKLKIVKASGKIRVLGTADTEGTIDELWATPDLKKLATPDMFYRQ